MPCPLVSLCVHVYVTFLLLHSIAFIAVLLFRSTTQDPLGLLVCAQTLCVDKAFVHTKTWWSAQRMRGEDSTWHTAYVGPIEHLYRMFCGTGPTNLCALSSCVPPNLCTKSLCASRSVCGIRGCSCRCKPYLHLLL